ncbi:MAG: SGNH/GDSL hydrolase family protein [Ignavibacteriaceae bacterium]
MKKLLNLILSLKGWFTIVLLVVFIVSGCQDRTNLTGPAPKSGSADLSRYVSIGNSITAGYQSGALYQSAQEYSYGNLIAQQVNSNYAIPFISDPGLGGRIEVQSFNPATGTLDLTIDTKTGAPINSSYPNSYNNLGVPGAVTYDVLNATSTATSASQSPYFNIILRNKGSQFTQAKSLNPTFLTLWIGNNDVLGYATSGGTSPASPTDANTFQYLYSVLGDSIASLGAKVVVANIPDVTAIPYFTTVGPAMAEEIPWAILKAEGSPGLFYQIHGNNSVDGTFAFADSADLATGNVLITLTGSTYAPLLGTATGKFYRDNGFKVLPVGIDTTQPFGFSPVNPWPDALILDPSEIVTAKTATQAFNSTIAAVANSQGFGIVDINSFFNSIAATGIVENGIGFSTAFFVGGLFGLDGVHPTSRGQAIIANEFLKVINNKFGASYSLVNVASIPGSIVLAKQNLLSKKILPHFNTAYFNHLLY